ncbi:MAG: preprotein translocase subunit SecG [Sedimentisphaerales bacterium]|nr:preprotein translocase subunit SecG [Sedimentisphaerales bacterium]
MTNVPLLGVSFLKNLIAALWVLSAIFLILIVLLQKGRGGGIGSAFGGGGAGSLLGTKTGDFLTWVTIGLVGVFLIFGVILVKFYIPETSVGLEENPTPPITSTTSGESSGTEATGITPGAAPANAESPTTSGEAGGTDTPGSPIGNDSDPDSENG